MAPSGMAKMMDKQTQIVLFSSTAIALYGYDQGMMSLINTNQDYLKTMGISEESAVVGVIVSVYYLGCAVGAVLFSKLSDARGRRVAIFACLLTACLGNALMFVAGINGMAGGKIVMLIGRIVMGLGVGGVDSVVPVYTAELSEDDARGTALAKEFQANIFGLNMAFIINVILTHNLGKTSEWAWRLPIIIMQIFPVLLFSGAALLPETPRWCILQGEEDRAKEAIKLVFGKDQVEPRMEELKEAHEEEQKDGLPGYADMIWPSGAQFHPTVITVMGQVNQALTGYGAVSVYGPQIFELLGFDVTDAEFLTLGNYIFYFMLMTLAWILIDRKGRRWLMITGAFWLAISFAILTVLGGLASNKEKLNIPLLATGVPGIIVLYLATSVFGIGWLVPPWLIPTEIYPSSVRSNGAAISVIIWGLANFAVTLLTPIGFNNLKYWLFLVFCLTNAFAGWWTWLYCPESGNRSFEENQEFYQKCDKEKSWSVLKVGGGEYRTLPDAEKDDEEEAGDDGAQNKKKDDAKKDKKDQRNGSGETEPLLASRNSQNGNNEQEEEEEETNFTI